MRMGFLKACALLAVPVFVLGAFGCAEEVGQNSGYLLQDTELYPEVSAPYEEESKAALARWEESKNNLLTSADVAREVAAELFAYACYNEEYLDRFVYFSDQNGSTEVGLGASEATVQNYKLMVRGTEENPGYKYHYTLKYVDRNSTGLPSAVFSTGNRLRFVSDGNKLYRFNADNIEYIDDEALGDDILTCTWNIDSGSWGTDDSPVVKRSGQKLTLDEIEKEIITYAQNGWEAIIHGNLNILADDIVESATITEMTSGEHTIYTVVMNIDTDVANADEASKAMLMSANSPASDCNWVSREDGGGFTIIYQIWDNGLFKLYGLNETWEGSIIGMSGSIKSTLSVKYSYSARDTDMTEKLAMLEEAKKLNEG